MTIRERDNTVSCILGGLLGDESNEMWEELMENASERGWTVGEEEPGYFDDMNWEPTPIDAAPGMSPHGFDLKRLSQNDLGRYYVHVTQYL